LEEHVFLFTEMPFPTGTLLLTLLRHCSYLTSLLFQCCQWLVNHIFSLSKASTVHQRRSNDSSSCFIEPAVVLIDLQRIQLRITVQDAVDVSWLSQKRLAFLRRILYRLKVSHEMRLTLLTFHALAIQIRTRSNRLEVVALGRFFFCALLERRKELFRCDLCWSLIGNHNFFSKKWPRRYSFFLLKIKCLILCVFCSRFLRYRAWMSEQFIRFCGLVNFCLFSYRFYNRLLFKGRDRWMLRSTSAPFYYSIALI